MGSMPTTAKGEKTMTGSAKPHLRLVWPPAVDEQAGEPPSVLEAALRAEGWILLSYDDLRRLPPDSFMVLRVIEFPDKPRECWGHHANKTFPSRLLNT